MIRLQLLTIFLMLSALCFGQNQSDGLVNQLITTPITQQFSGQEIFRFQPGVVTQLAAGSTAFDFSSSQWFSIGNLDTSLLNPPFQGTNEVFGLRFQLPNKALIYGYQDIGDINPRIQWIGSDGNLGSLEFRAADSFSSTNSKLIASMTRNGRFIMADNPSLITPSATKFSLSSNNLFKIGIYSVTSGVNLGTAISGIGINNSSNVGVKGLASNAISSGNFAYGIYGVSQQSPFTSSFAGFFDGDVNVTGTLTHGSDRKLKSELKETENVLENLSQLNAYTYTFKDNENINLPIGLQHGLIAQEVEKVYPELVQDITYPIYNEKEELVDTDTYKSVNYIGLISELTAAIKELNTKVKDLESQVESRVVYSSKFTAGELEKITKNAYKLEQNIPNPFTQSTLISYALPEDSTKASILVFDLNGRMLRSYELNEKNGKLKINATELNDSGMYLYTLFANGEEIITKKMILK